MAAPPKRTLKPAGPAALLGSLMAAAALLRFSGLTRQSLWVDEVLSMRVANRILSLSPGSELFNIHGPVFFYVLAPMLSLSPSELLARIPSALAGVALVGMVYLLGRDLVDRRTGLAAAAVAAFSPFALWYSQEVRYVSTYLMLAAASAWSAFRFLRSGTVRAGAAHAVSTILMLLAFPAGIFVCMAENLWALGSRPDARRLARWLLAQAAIGLVFLPWLYLAYAHLPPPHPETTGLPIQKASTGFDRPLHPLHIGYPLFTFGAGLTIGPSNRDLHHDLSLGPLLAKPGQVAVAVLITGALALIGSLVLLRRAPAGGRLLLLLVATSLLGPYALAGFSKIAYNVRYTSGGFPAYLVILGAGAAWAAGKKPWGWGLLAGYAALMVFSLSAYFTNPYYFRDDNRAAAAFVAGKIRPGEPLVVGAEDRAFVHYFRGPITNWRRWKVDPQGAGTIEGIGGEPGRFWVAANRDWEEPAFQEFLASMRRCFTVEDQAEFPGYRVYAFRAGDGRAACSVSYQRSSGRAAAPEAVAATP